MQTIPWSQGLAARISWCRDFPFLGTQSRNYKLPQVDCSRVEPIENKMNGIWLEKEHPRGPHLPSPVLSLFLVSSAIFWRCWAPRRDSPRPGPPPCPVRSSPPSVSDICPPPWPACWSGCGPAPAWIWSEEDSSGVSGAQFSALSSLYLGQRLFLLLPAAQLILHLLRPEHGLLYNIIYLYCFITTNTNQTSLRVQQESSPILSFSLWSTFSCLADIAEISFSIIFAASALFLADFWNMRSALDRK